MTGVHHGLFPANFENFLIFLPKHPQANAFVPFRPLWDFTTVLKTVTIFLLLHCGSWPRAAQRKQQSFGILNKQVSNFLEITSLSFYLIISWYSFSYFIIICYISLLGNWFIWIYINRELFAFWGVVNSINFCFFKTMIL